MKTGLERITTLTQPPVVGRFYLVPTVRYPWLRGNRGPWPVFQPKHEDKEHLNFPLQHYHVDPRFLGAVAWSRAANWRDYLGGHGGDDDAFATCQSVPLSYKETGGPEIPHPPVVWRKRKCIRAEIPYQHHDKSTIQGLAKHYEGAQCRSNRAGWVCPHKRFTLGSIGPDADGVITCPLHGLRIRACDGIVMEAMR